MGNFLLYIFFLFLDPLLFRTGSVQCMLVKMGIISCSRLSGLIRVLFIRVNWYLKSFPLQWQGFFTLNYLGPWIAVLHVRHVSRWKCESLRPARMTFIYLFQLQHCTIFLLFCTGFELPLREATIRRMLLCHSQSPRQAHLLSSHHFPPIEPFSHSLHSRTLILIRKPPTIL